MKASNAQERTELVRKLALEKAEQAGQDPPDLAPLSADVMAKQGLALRPMSGCIAQDYGNCSDPDSLIMKSDDTWLLGHNCQVKG